MLSLSYYVQHFLPFSFAEAASERRFFRGCSAGARLINSDASVRKASSTFNALFAEVSRNGHASSSDFARAYRRAERAAVRRDGAERRRLGRRAGVGVGVARAGCRCFGPGEGEDGDQAEHFLLRAFSLSDARCASSEPSAGYRASRGFARVPLVTRGAVRVNSWPSEMSVINGS